MNGPDGRHVLVEAKGRTVSAANGSWSFSQIFGENRSKRYDFILLVGERHPEPLCKDDGAGDRYALFLLSYADAERLTGRRKFQRPRQDGKAPKDHGTLRIKAYGTISGHSVPLGVTTKSRPTRRAASCTPRSAAEPFRPGGHRDGTVGSGIGSS